MKTTLNLPDDLMRAVKIRAVEDNRKLQDTVASLLRRGLGLDSPGSDSVRKRTHFPLVLCAHPARPGEELTPERLAEILLDEEVDNSRVPLR